jgi:hypothetical protein
MRSIPLLIAVSGLSGAVLGFAGAALWLRDGAGVSEASSAPMALRASSEADARGGRRWEEPETTGGGNRKGSGGEAETTSAGIEKDSRAAELNELRARANAAREQLALARKRLAQLEEESDEKRAPKEKRGRHDYDLTPEDWKKMAGQGMVKYRVPCGGGAASAPAAEVIDELGLAPEDGDVLRQAFEHSASRQRNALLPLCAEALGGRMDLAQAMNTDSCRQVLISSAVTGSESDSLGAQRVASFMAGEAPRPDETSSVSERMFLALAEESKHFEVELAEAFGPEEAHRLVFSDRLCFSKSAHKFSSSTSPSPDR